MLTHSHTLNNLISRSGLIVLFASFFEGFTMTVINVVAGEYGSTAVTLSQVSSELQGAKIDDLSETVQESMNGAQSISTAGTVESRYTSLLQTHSTALSELASAARSAGVNLDLTEAQNTAAVNSQGQAVPGGANVGTAASSVAAQKATALNGPARGPLRSGYAMPTLPTTTGGAQVDTPVYRPGQGMPPYAPSPTDYPEGDGFVSLPTPPKIPVMA